MEKKIGSINVTETDTGYRIDVEGKDLKGLFANCCCCCGGSCCSDKSKESNCC